MKYISESDAYKIVKEEDTVIISDDGLKYIIRPITTRADGTSFIDGPELSFEVDSETGDLCIEEDRNDSFIFIYSKQLEILKDAVVMAIKIAKSKEQQ